MAQQIADRGDVDFVLYEQLGLKKSLASAVQRHEP
ncbi:MAG: acyl-CoA dehydrogenase N-terminal domain-containing protein [Desulfobacterales bacterium]